MYVTVTPVSVYFEHIVLLTFITIYTVHSVTAGANHGGN